MKTYDFALISAREYPTVKILDHPHIWDGVQFCVNLSGKPYSPELEAALASHGIEWIHCPVSEESGSDWLPSFSVALPMMYMAFKEGKKQIVHCDLGNNRSRSFVEALFFAIKHEEYNDPYKDADNHLEYNCIQGHLPNLGELERRIYAMTELYTEGKRSDVKQMSRVLLSPSPNWARGGIFTFFTKSNDILGGVKCATPFFSEIHDAVENFHDGRPVRQRITVDDVEMTVLDDWKWAGATSIGENEWRDIYAPLVCVNGVTENLDVEGIKGFTPQRGHEYILMVRRIYITKFPCYHHYELIEVISDGLTENA